MKKLVTGLFGKILSKFQYSMYSYLFALLVITIFVFRIVQALPTKKFKPKLGKPCKSCIVLGSGKLRGKLCINFQRSQKKGRYAFPKHGLSCLSRRTHNGDASTS